MLNKITGQEILIVIVAILVLLFIYSSILFGGIQEESVVQSVSFENDNEHQTIMTKQEFEKLVEQNERFAISNDSIVIVNEMEHSKDE